MLVRVHAVNVLADLLGIGSSEGTRGALIEKAMRRDRARWPRCHRPHSGFAAEGGVELDRAKRRTQEAQTHRQMPERRRVEIGVGSQILRDLGVTDMVLLSNAPPSRYVGLEAFGLRIVGQRRIG